jgi:hypothetical protein
LGICWDVHGSFGFVVGFDITASVFSGAEKLFSKCFFKNIFGGNCNEKVLVADEKSKEPEVDENEKEGGGNDHMGSEGNDFIMPKSCPSYLTRRHFSKLVVWFSGGHHSENRCWMGAYLTDEESSCPLCNKKSRKVFVEPSTVNTKLYVDAVDIVDIPIDKDASESEQSSSNLVVQLYNEFIFVNQVRQR